MLAIASVLVIMAMSVIVTRVATVALTLTGLSRQSARFQARSALSGAGYTTSESERIVNHPVRRRIIMWLMLIGSAGIVTAVASLMLTFVGTQDRGDALERVGAIAIGTALLLWASSSHWVERRLERVISVALRRWTDLDTRDYAALLHVHGDFAITEMQIQESDWLAGRSLVEARLSDEGVLVLGIQRPDGTYVGVPTGETLVRVDDVLILYGRTSRLGELDDRRAGRQGDHAHSRAKVEQELQLHVQRQADAAADGRTHAEP